MSKGTIVIAMSGGVDSAVAAALLKQDEWDVIGITMQIWQEREGESKNGGCCSLGAVEDARRCANKLGIPHYVLNLKEYFNNNVIDLFISEYSRGRTPNPCVECNRSVKFEELFRQSKAMGADYLATGHYARTRYNETTCRWEMLRAVNSAKDQSYALYTLDQQTLAHTIFPLGELKDKSETRQIARELGLNVASRPDSQEICFVSEEGYTSFLAEKAPETMQPGPIVDKEGRVIGEHQGVAQYTIGQRKRLPGGAGEPRFVISLDPATRTVVTGRDADLFAKGFIADKLNWISIEQPEWPLAVSARIRYNGTASPACLFSGSYEGSVHCIFDEPQRAVTPGQAAVFYQGDVIVGGGTIEQRAE